MGVVEGGVAVIVAADTCGMDQYHLDILIALPSSTSSIVPLMGGLEAGVEWSGVELQWQRQWQRIHAGRKSFTLIYSLHFLLQYMNWSFDVR
jgi:hypothetical protein